MICFMHPAASLSGEGISAIVRFDVGRKERYQGSRLTPLKLNATLHRHWLQVLCFSYEGHSSPLPILLAVNSEFNWFEIRDYGVNLMT